MEKIFIKPVSKEILLKGSKDGPTDIFSYDYEADQAKRPLGNLYVVGNIQDGAAGQSEDLDVGYVINLVASLAKREYYAHPDAQVKDAFTAALKKINGVVEEFFKNKDTKINIGIFTVAGGEIHISKLGKFKILLARDGKAIDILNNIQLFNKETTQEKEFSNIISGKVHEGDQILAFYPNRTLTAREKLLKESFLKGSQEEFVATLASIKDQKPDFSCAALHINLEKGVEAAVEPHIQPKEMRTVAEDEETGEGKTPLAVAPAILAKNDDLREDEPVNKPEPKVEAVSAKKTYAPERTEFPKIIPSEFALGKKALPFAKHLRRFKSMNMNPQTRLVMIGGLVVILLVVGVALKMTVFVSPQAKEVNAAVTQAQNNLKLAQQKGSSDPVAARELLVGSLASLADAESKDGSSSKITSIKNDITKALDGMENAVDTNPVQIADLTSQAGTAKLIVSAGADFYAYLDQNGAGSLVKISGGNTGTATAVKNISPSAIFASDNYVALVDPSGKITSLSIKKSVLGNSSFSNTNPLVSFDVYQDNLYGLTASGIMKITDAASGYTQINSWLQNGATLPANASLITVDGKVYVLSGTGTLTTYFKGQKTNETKTSVAVGNDSMLLTTANSTNLFVVNKSLGRIYVIKKDSGTLDKTLKITAPIVSATLASDDTIYIISDNKIWKIQ